MPELSYDFAGKRVWVAGHRGMVGSALMRRLAHEQCELLTVGRDGVDLRRQAETEDWIAETRPQLVFLAAAKVGGILANRDQPADFLYDNLMIEANVLEAARRCGTERLVLLGSSCVYPKHASQPIREEALLSGPLEPTNEAYAVAKIAGIKLVEGYRAQHGCSFISVQPSNIYGPGDNFDPQSSHVLAALLRKAHEAKVGGRSEMVVWGTGAPRREFLHVDDLADALVFLARHYDDSRPINIGSGEEITVRGLAELIAKVSGFGGRLRFDTSKPDGTPRKVVDTTRLEGLGWRASIPLVEGIEGTYAWFCDHLGAARGMAALAGA